MAIEPRELPAVIDPVTGKFTSRATRVLPPEERVIPQEEPKPVEPKPVEPKSKEPVDVVDYTDYIGPTGSVSGNISEYGVEAPSYTEPTKTAADILAEQQMQAAAKERQDAMLLLSERFAKYGLSGLTDVIKKLAIEGATEATITLTLQDTPEYKERFKANQTRLQKGLAVLSPADYIAVEDSYRQILRSYGLNQFDNDTYVTQFIENDVSPTELNNRVQIAAKRISLAAPGVKETLSRYYGIADADLLAYALDPKGSLPQIEKQVTTAEIGTAAARQGIDIQRSAAEYLTGLGVTEDQAVKGFGTIADILPTAQKLTDIYKDGLEGYGLEQAQAEIFGQLASERRKREKLIARETASFAGQSGTTRQSLTQSSTGLI